MKKFIITFLASCFVMCCNALHVMAQPPKDILLDDSSKEFINLPGGKGDGVVDFLGLIQTVLLKLVLPVVAIGTGLYIAYILFTAEGDESKQKKVWTAVVNSVVGIICIMLSYFVVGLISGLKIG